MRKRQKRQKSERIEIRTAPEKAAGYARAMMKDKTAKNPIMPVEVLVHVMIDAKSWRGESLDFEAIACEMVQATFAHLGDIEQIDAACEISISLTDDRSIQDLNLRFRHIDAATNVLAFPEASAAAGAPDEGGTGRHLGDIAMAFGTVSHESREQGKTLEQHFRHLTVHGVLHLLGYDHVDTGDAEEMESLEQTILAQFDVPDPYVDARTEVG